MAKITDKKKKLIIADYIQFQNYREVSRKHGVAVNTVKNIVLADSEVAQQCTQKAEQNTIDTLTYMQEQHETKKRIIEKLLLAMEKKAEKADEDMFTNIRDIAMAYGVIVDKELKFAEVKAAKNQADSQGIMPQLLEALKHVKQDVE